MNSNSVFKRILNHTCFGAQALPDIISSPAPSYQERLEARLLAVNPVADVQKIVEDALISAKVEAEKLRDTERERLTQDRKVSSAITLLQGTIGPLASVLNGLMYGGVHSKVTAREADDILKKVHREIRQAGRQMRLGFGIDTRQRPHSNMRPSSTCRVRHCPGTRRPCGGPRRPLPWGRP